MRSTGLHGIIIAQRARKINRSEMINKRSILQEWFAFAIIPVERGMVMGYRFDFSLVMPIYRVEAYLQEALDSALAQDYPAEKVQLVLVDDGSPDGCGAICDACAAKHPDRVKVIHQTNQKSGGARMSGIRAAEGKYIGFLDPDDRLAPNVLSSVWSFFEAHGDEVDAVTFPMRYFGVRCGQPSLSRMAKRGCRVIHLEKEWRSPVLGVNHCFYRNEIAQTMDMDRQLICLEDSKENIRVLLDRMKIGVVDNTCYDYRIVGMGLTAKRYKDLRWFTETFQLYHDWAHEECLRRRGEMPLFVQYMLMTELAARIRQETIACAAMDDAMKDAYRDRVAYELRRLDDKAILSRPGMTEVQTSFAMQLKYGEAPTALPNNRYGLGGQTWGKLDSWTVAVSDIRMADGRLQMEGVIDFPSWMQHARLEFQLGDSRIVPDQWLAARPILSMEKVIGTRFLWRIRIPLTERSCGALQPFLRMEQEHIPLHCVKCSRNTDWSHKLPALFAADSGIALVREDGQFALRPCGRLGRLRLEARLARALVKQYGKKGLRAEALRLCVMTLKPFRRKPIWVLQDETADGQAAALYAAWPKDQRAVKPVLVLPKGVSGASGHLTAGSFRAELNRLLAAVDLRGTEQTEVSGGMPGLRVLAGSTRRVLLGGLIAVRRPKEMQRHRLGFDAVLTALPQDPALWLEEGYAPERLCCTGLPRWDSFRQTAKQPLLVFAPGCPMELWKDRDLKQPGFPFQLRPDADQAVQVKLFSRLMQNETLGDLAEQRGVALQWLRNPYLHGLHAPYAADQRLTEAAGGIADTLAKAAWVVTDDPKMAADALAAKAKVLWLVPEGETPAYPAPIDMAFTPEEAEAWMQAALEEALGDDASETAEGAAGHTRRVIDALRTLVGKGDFA